MRILTIEFTRSSKKFAPFSWLIRLVQGVPYSHVRLRWISGSGEELIYEAGGFSVRLIGKLAQPLHPVLILESFEIEVSDSEYKNLIKLFRFAGVSYSIKQIVGIAIAIAFKLKRNILTQGRLGQVCSELVGLALKEVKQWNVNYNLDVAGPKEIYEFLTSLVQTGTIGIKHVISGGKSIS